MKQLTCEMCGSTDLIKQDGIFVCQTYGTKYSVEETKKMMVEGVVSVKVVHDEENDRLKRRADEAFNDGQYDEAGTLYIEFLKQADGDYESIFRRYLAQSNCWGTIRNHFPNQDESLKIVIKKLSEYAEQLNSDDSLSQKTKNERIYFIKAYRYNTALCKVRKDGLKTSVIASQISKFIRIEAGYLYYIDDVSDLHKVRMDGSRNKIIAHLVDKVLSIKEDKVIYIAKDKLIKDSSYDFNGSEVLSKQYNNSIYVIEFSDTGRRKACYDIVDGSCFDKGKVYYTKYKKIKSDYEEKNQLFLYSLNIDNYETKELVELRVPEKAGCYVATCVYGSYDCPQVWTLRRYRDYKLAKTWFGRAFIHTYYAVSPTLVKWFGKTKWFKQLWKGKLDKMVSKLQEQGFKDTPYKDKNW